MINRTQSIALTLAAIAVSVFVVCSCSGRKEMSNRVIVQNEAFTVTGDSIIEDTVWATVPSSRDRIKTNITVARLDSLYGHVGGEATPLKFEGGRSWRKHKKRPALMPEFKSDQPLVDVLYDMSTDCIADAIDSNGRFNVTHNNSRLYCSIYLSLAALKPHQSMATLRAIVDLDSIIMQREGQWPVVSDHVGWATAAWEVYKVTGDREWLAYCKHVIEKTLAINRAVLMDQRTGLVHGAGYTPARPMGVRRMTWMGYNDFFACMSLGNNILTGNAYRILSEMCDELGIENEYQEDALHIKNSINQHLWNEDRGLYSSFLYGTAFPQQSSLTDNTSQAMCVLWGIADDNRAENLIAHTPVSDMGVNVTYPATNLLEPYFVNSSWATTQALWNMAAANVGNENALRRGLGALYRAQALYQSRGIHASSVKTDDLGTSASNAAMAMRVLLGMSFEAEGIEFSPLVPSCFPGKKTFKGLNYRKAVLDVTIEGTGNDVASITDNGTEMESAFIPCDIEGRHHIVITLQEGNRKSQRVTIHRNEIFLPPTPSVIWKNDSGFIEDYQPNLDYRLSVNGELQPLTDSAFALPQTDVFAEYAVIIAGKQVNGFMSKPLLKFGLTPQIAFFPDSPDGHAVINVSVAVGGDYLIDVGYRPTGSLDVRRVSANSHPMGTLVMAKSNGADQEELVYSNIVAVKLLKGENHIEIDQLRLPKAFTPCEPVHVRVIRLD